jgi:hypothetical protein
MARIEVITGPERRRRWSAEQKRAIVAGSLAPGAAVTEIARRADICAGQLYRWEHGRHYDLSHAPERLRNHHNGHAEWGDYEANLQLIRISGNFRIGACLQSRCQL